MSDRFPTSSERQPEPADSLCFRWPWRPYQERVLRSLQEQLTDRRVHIVAAPGSGKTILGLEIFRRLGRPAVAFSPTTTIRDQWILRLGDFLPADTPAPPEWASTSLQTPKYFTSITYQALHTKYRLDDKDEHTETEVTDDDEAVPTNQQLAEIVHLLKRLGVATLIFDEAHHLQKEWWKALRHMVDEFGDATLISLTATPPYTALGSQWRHYEDLCGPVDEEISVPELVKVDTLCPHQDFVWMVPPTEKNAADVRQFDKAVEKFISEIYSDPVFADAVLTHPWIIAAEPPVDQVLENPEFAVSLLVFLKAKEKPLSKGLLRLLDCKAGELPKLDRRWYQALIERYLFDESWPLNSSAQLHRKDLLARLRREGLLWKRELRIVQSRSLKRLLSLSSSKIKACLEVSRVEERMRGEQLRQVILTDFVGDPRLTNSTHQFEERLDACAVFTKLVSALPESTRTRVALLTGKIAVVHQARIERCQTTGHLSESVFVPLDVIPGYVRIDNTPHDLSKIVAVITALLAEGEIRILVGTRALIGEGWDAPCVNSLVIASFVGSFVLTNQMRGRALRIDSKDKAKVASVWHLVTADLFNWSGQSDLVDLNKRFQTFVGLAHTRPAIENGLERLDLPPLAGLDALDLNNSEMRHRLADIRSIEQQWKDATEAGTYKRVVPAVSTRNPRRFRTIHFRNTLMHASLLAALAFGQWFFGNINALLRFSTEQLSTSQFVLAWVSAIGLLGTLPGLFRSLKLWLLHLPVDGSLQQISVCLLDTMVQTHVLKTARNKFRIVVSNELGKFSIALTGGSYYEQQLFADCLKELLGPIENPRYLLTRRSLRWLGRRRDYHAVPHPISSEKTRAEIFYRYWQQRMGSSELIYTRSQKGRKILLQARARAFSTAFLPTCERRDRWQ